MTIGIVGFGIMGRSIALASAQAGFEVHIFDSRSESMSDDLAELTRDAGKTGKFVALKQLEPLAGCSLIIEAIPESLASKHELFRALDRIAPDAILVSNTSTFTPGELSTVLQKPGRLMVGHFFNPANLVPLVELVPGQLSSADDVEFVRSFLLAIGKHPVVLHSETPGFVANRIQAAVLRECFSLIEQGVASPQDIDSIVKLSLAPRWAACGPIAIADLGGLDTFVALSDRLFPELSRSETAPEQMRDLVKAGNLGAKTGSGMYQWGENERAGAVESISTYFELRSQINRDGVKAPR